MMRRLALALALVGLVAFAACDTDPADNETDTGVTLHGSGGCKAGQNLWWSFDVQRLVLDANDNAVPSGNWVPVGPQQWVNCAADTSADLALTQRVEGLPPGAAYQYRLTVYYQAGPLGNNRWVNYDSEGTEYGSNYDEFQTTETIDAGAGGESECDFTVVFCDAARRIPRNQLQWVFSYQDGTGKHYPYASNHLFAAQGSNASTTKRCKIDVRYKRPATPSGPAESGVERGRWFQPAGTEACTTVVKFPGIYVYKGARFYIRAYLNDTDDHWSLRNNTFGPRALGTCTHGRYTDGRDLLRCNAAWPAGNPPTVDDP